jgi:hypothetical protein
MAVCVAVPLMAALEGCASHQAPISREGPPVPAGALFISPHGEPFRGEAKGVSPKLLWFAHADTDHDQRISKAEFEADAQAFFTRLDANNDGFVVSPDVTSLDQQLAPELLRVYGPMEDFVGPEEAAMREEMAASGALSRKSARDLLGRPRGAQAFGMLNEIEPVMSADTDVNRHVTIKEFLAAADRHFARLDANKDGYFKIEEAPKPVWKSAGN